MENRKFVIFLAPVIALGLFLAWPKISLGYDTGTHEFLTDTAIRLYDKNYPQNKIDSALNSFVLDGTRREDDPPRWMNHFYDPVYERGLSQDNAIDPLYKLGNWQESKLWAQDGTNQNNIKYSPIIATILSSIQSGKIEKFFPTADFTWNEALRYWIQGDKEMAMFTLGHILHLVQDVSVPDHTRNDPHPGDSPYENYSAQYTLSNPDNDLSQSVSKNPLVSLSDLNSYFVQLANYSNNNFYSKDTIGIQSGYSSPSSEEYNPVNINGQMEYYGLKKDNLGNEYLLVLKKSLNNNLVVTNNNDVIIDDGKIEYDYWRLLSPKAVEYSAGVINLFFQDVEKNKNNPEFTQKEKPSFLGQVTQTVQNGYNAAKNFVLGVFGSGQFEPIAEVNVNNPADTSNADQNTNQGNSAITSENPQPNGQNNISGNKTEKTYKVTRVIDGDTIVLENGTVVRYIGIDAPELSDTESKSDCLAKEARERNKQLVLSKEVRLESGPQKTDKYDRTLAYVWVQNIDANAVLIKEGFAYAYNFKNAHPREDEFAELQEEAKNAKAGIWGESCAASSTNKSNKTSTSTQSEPPKTTDPAKPVACLYSTTQPPSHSGIQINEVAWMGSANSASDEWIELKNTSSSEVNLSGYWLIGRDNQIEINLSSGSSTSIGPSAFYLLERSNNESVPGVTADIIYSGSLGNSNEGLRLFSPGCILVDEVLASSSWPAGDNATKKTMERDRQGFGWHSSLGAGGTPKQENSIPSGITWTGSGGGYTSQTNSAALSTASSSDTTPQFFPVAINEIMYNPEGTDTNREWIEILNTASTSVDISEWRLFENDTAHRLNLISGNFVLQPGEFAIIADDGDQFKIDYPFFSGNLFDSSFSLNNEGEVISLKNGDLKIDEISYSPSGGADGNGKSLQKFSDNWEESLPTPGKENLIDASTDRFSHAPSHLLISEIQVDGEGPDDEFVEIYNPTLNPISLSDYSIQYISGKATTTKNVYKKIIDAPLTVAPFGFALFANKAGIFSQNSDVNYSFSLSGESSGGIILLSNSSGTIESLNQNEIVDLVAYGNTEMPGITKAIKPENNQSIERKALSNDYCTSSQNKGEFLGNACDTNDNEYDFELRLNPRRQGLSNLAEPRTAPNPAQNLSISYAPGSTNISASWQAPAENGAFGPFTYKIIDSDTDTVLATTTALTNETLIDEVGRDYAIALTAADKEGLESLTATSSITVPSYIKSLSIFKNPQSSNDYVLEGSYDQLPLISNPNANGDILVFFINKDAPKEPSLAGGYPSGESRDGLIQADYRHCSGISGSRDFLALTQNPCPQGGMMTEALPQEYLEDKIFSLKISPESSLVSSDYFTIAFYTFEHSNLWSGGTDIYRIAAVDKTKYYFSDITPTHSSPIQIQNFTAELHEQDSTNNSYALLKWDDTTDADSIDKSLMYEYNISKNNTSLDDSGWIEIKRELAQTSDGQGGVTTTQIGPQIPLLESGNYTFYLRAKDELGLTSTSSTSTVEIIIPSFITGIQDETCNYCNTTNFATIQGSANPYMAGQVFTLQSPTKISEIQIELHNFAAPSDMNIPPSNFDAKISINSMDDSSDPNVGLQEIFSTNVTNLPALTFPNKNYTTVKIPSPVNLQPGTYFIKLETIGGSLSHPSQGIAFSTVGSDKYSQGRAYFVYSTAEYPPSLWSPVELNMYFRIFGASQ